jgi:uncharacterized membrane protein
LKTKINIANGIGIISFLVGTALLLFSPLATLLIFVGVCCLYLVGKWQKQARLQAEGQGIPGPVPSADARKRNLLIATIGIGASLMVTTPLFLYLSPGLQGEAPAFIGGILVSYALIIFVLWRKKSS